MAAPDEHPPYPSPPPTPTKPGRDTILASCLRYTLSQQEYCLLVKHIRSRLPPAIGTRAPPADLYDRLPHAQDEYAVSAVRASIRVFLISQTGLQLWEQIKKRILGNPAASR